MKSELFLGLAVLVLGHSAHAATYQVGKDSAVSFLAKITASSFVARSKALSGTVDYDEASGTVKAATIRVKADSFDTGMSLRNDHMRDKYLEAKKFPDIVFTLENGKVTATPGSESTLTGAFVIKGVKKPTTVKLEVKENAGGKLAASSAFKLDITEYGIPQPKFTMVKMETIIDVSLELVLAKP